MQRSQNAMWLFPCCPFVLSAFLSSSVLSLFAFVFSSVPLLRHDSLDDLVHLPGSLQLPLPTREH